MREYISEEECEDDSMYEIETIGELRREEEKGIIEPLPYILCKR